MLILLWHRIITVNSHQAVFPPWIVLLIFCMFWNEEINGHFDALNGKLLLLTTFMLYWLFWEGKRVSSVFVMLTNQTGIDCWIQSISVVLILILFCYPFRSVQFKIDTIRKIFSFTQSMQSNNQNERCLTSQINHWGFNYSTLFRLLRFYYILTPAKLLNLQCIA